MWRAGTQGKHLNCRGLSLEQTINLFGCAWDTVQPERSAYIRISLLAIITKYSFPIGK